MQPTISPGGAPRRALIVDDNKDAADTLRMVVEAFGFKTQVAYDGIRGLEEARAFRPDVVILDIGMPRMSGYDVARLIRAEAWGRDMLLIAITGWGQYEDRRLATDAGFDHHLCKPADLDLLQKLMAS